MFLRRLLSCVPQGAVPVGRAAGIAAACIVGATALRWLFDGPMHGAPFLIFIPAVLIAGAFGGNLAGVATLLAGLIAGFAFWAPVSSHWAFRDSSWAPVAYLIVGSIVLVVVGMLHHLVRSKVEAERQAALLAGEMRHRVKNTLALVQVLSRMTSRSVETVEQYENVLSGRIMALAKAQDFATDHGGDGAGLRELLNQILEPFGSARFTLDGPPVSLPSDIVPMLSLVLFELGTNASKYGALSVPAGRVEISWKEKDVAAHITWRERHGPSVAEHRGKGFGSRLLAAAFPPTRGSVETRYEPGGAVCSIRVNLAPLSGS